MTTDERLDTIDAKLSAILKAIQLVAPPQVASDKDLDSQYGDPILKFTPRDWTGDPCTGKRMSECEAACLDMLAETFDYFAAKADAENKLTSAGKPVSAYNRKDAARARGWAKRVRDGKVKPIERVKDPDDPFANSDIPF